jgi:hypothetical protein
MHDSCLGLAIAAMAPLILGTQFILAPTCEGASWSPPTLETTIYIEADDDRQELGYEGYTLSPRDGGYRVEVVGAERHEGTIVIDTDNATYFVSTATRDGDTSTLEVSLIGDSMAQAKLDGDLIGVAFSDPVHGLLSYTTVPAIEGSPAIDVLLAVLNDENFRDQVSDPIPIGGWLLVPLGAAYLALLWQCSNWESDCQQTCWDPNSVACQNWVDWYCTHSIPRVDSVANCCGWLDGCNHGHQPSCDAYNQMQCGYLLQSCDCGFGD